jgi:phospholipase/lecithinase/hemolysin
LVPWRPYSAEYQPVNSDGVPPETVGFAQSFTLRAVRDAEPVLPNVEGGTPMVKRCSIFLAMILFISWRQASADIYTFNQIYVFGDSLSDTGNLNNLTSVFGQGQFLTPPKYTAARFTDGADTTPAARDAKYVANGGYNVVWHEQLAKMVGMPAASASLVAGNKQNYAYGGATTGTGTTLVAENTPLGDIKVNNISTQVANFIAGGNIPAKGLYVLWGGGNDLRNFLFNSFNDNLIDPTFESYTKPGIVGAADQAVKNIGDRIADLINANLKNGATQFLWPDLPPLDQTPKFRSIDGMVLGDGTLLGDALEAAVQEFKTAEEARIAALQKQFAAQNVKIVEMDVYTTVNNILGNPAKYGYTNVKDQAQMLAANMNPDTYLFWDEFHPTSHAHYDLAQLALQSLRDAGLAIATPEPSSFVLSVMGLGGLVLWRRAKGRRRAVAG